MRVLEGVASSGRGLHKIRGFDAEELWQVEGGLGRGRKKHTIGSEGTLEKERRRIS